MAPSRVTKKRSDSAKQQHPIQYWDGKTYACMACKRGHRVKLCDHGKDGKLVSATNQPGRPSSGSDRKCTCPKSCKCTTNCKCAKEGCICVQRMFLVVALKSQAQPESTNPDPEPIPQWTDENGEQKTLNPVFADMNGNILSPEEAKAREEEKERRRVDIMSKPEKSSCCSSKQPKHEPAPTPSPGPGCRHREGLPHKSVPATPPTNAASRCTCGVKCQCTLCPEHPNNSATRHYNAQQLNAMASNPSGSYMPSQSTVNGQLFKPEVPQGSCLGGEASYFLIREQPTLYDFQRMFPDYAPGDFVLTYPMEAPTHTYNQMNSVGPADFTLAEGAYTTQVAMPVDTLPSLPENDYFNDMALINQPLNFTFGDADVTRFGYQALASPELQHAASQNQDTVQSLGCCAPQNVLVSQTITPEILQARVPCTAPSRDILHSTSSLTSSVSNGLFFDNNMAPFPDGIPLNMSPSVPNIYDNPPSTYRPLDFLASSRSSSKS